MTRYTPVGTSLSGLEFGKFVVGTDSNPAVAVANPDGSPVIGGSGSSVFSTLQNAATSTGNGSTISVLGQATVMLTVSGTYTGLSLVIEGAEDSVPTWSTLTATQLGTNVFSTTISGGGVYQVSVSGLQSLRARITAIASGSVTVTAHAVPVSFTERAVDAHMADKLDRVNDSVSTYANPAFSTNITTAATTTVFSFPGVIREIEVLGGTLGNVTVYDNTAASGTVLTAAFTPIAGQVFARNVVCAIGCTIVTAAATALLVKWEAQ